ncbi:unnamed protein product [Closterium sp. NIES-54]
MAELEEAGTGIALTLYPITSLQIGRKTSKGSILSVHIAKEAGQLVFFVNSPWCPKRSSGKDAGLWQLLSKAPRYDSPFANNSLMDRLLGEIMALEDSFCRTPRLGSGSSGGGGGSIGGIGSSSGRHRRVKWRSLDAFVRRLHARRRALSHLHPPPHGLCGCVTLEVSWSDVRGLRYENELQADANLAMEVTRVVKREFDSFDQAVHAHALRLYPATPSHGTTPLHGANQSHASVPAASPRVPAGPWMGGSAFSGNRVGPKSPLGAAAAASGAAGVGGGGGAAAGGGGALYSSAASSFAAISFAGSSRLAAAVAAADAGDAARAAASIVDAACSSGLWSRQAQMCIGCPFRSPREAFGSSQKLARKALFHDQQTPPCTPVPFGLHPAVADTADAGTREELVAFQSTRSRISDSQLCNPPHQHQRHQEQGQQQQQQRQQQAGTSQSSSDLHTWMSDSSERFSEGCSEVGLLDAELATQTLLEGECCDGSSGRAGTNGGAAEERMLKGNEPGWLLENESRLYRGGDGAAEEGGSFLSGEPSYKSCWENEPQLYSESRSTVHDDVEAESSLSLHYDVEAVGMELSACDYIDAEPHHNPYSWEEVEAESPPSVHGDVDAVGVVSRGMHGEMEADGMVSNVHVDMEADGIESSVYEEMEAEVWDSPEGWEEVEAESAQTVCDERDADGEGSSVFHEMEAESAEAESAEAESAEAESAEAESAEAESAVTVHGGVERELFPSILIPRRLFVSTSCCRSEDGEVCGEDDGADVGDRGNGDVDSDECGDAYSYDGHEEEEENEEDEEEEDGRRGESFDDSCGSCSSGGGGSRGSSGGDGSGADSYDGESNSRSYCSDDDADGDTEGDSRGYCSDDGDGDTEGDSRSYCSTSSSAKQHQHHRHHQHQHERQQFTSPSRTLPTHRHPSTLLTSPGPHLPSPHQRTPPTHLIYPSTLLSSPKPLLPAPRAPPTTIIYPDTLLLFRFTHPHLPAALADVITTDQRLLHQLESGLPSWAVFLQSCAGLSALYRPWMRPLVAYACFIVSLVTVLIGFYDLYKNIPVLQEMLARMLGPIWAVVGTWDMGTRLRYLGTILFLQNWERAFKWLSSSLKVISHAVSLLSYLLSLLLRPFQHPCSLLLHTVLLCLTKLLSTAWNLLSALGKLVTSSGGLLGYVMRPLWLLGQHTLVPVWQLLNACYLAVYSTGVAISNGCLLLYQLLSQAYSCSVLKLAHLLSSLVSSRVSFLYSNCLLLYRFLSQACSNSVWKVAQLLSAQLSFFYSRAMLLGRLLGMLLHPLLLLARTLWAIGRAIILPLFQFIHLLLTPLLSALLSLLKLPLQLFRLLLQLATFLYSTFSHSLSHSLTLSLASSLKALSLHFTHLSNTLLLHLVYLSKTLVQPITYSIKAFSFTFAYGYKSVANSFSYISKTVSSSLRLVVGARKLGSATKAVGQQISAAGSAVGQVSSAAGSAVVRSSSSSLLQMWHNLFQKLFRAIMWIFKGVGSFVAAANRHRLSTRHYVLSQVRKLQARVLQAAQHAQSTLIKYGRKLLAPRPIPTAPREVAASPREILDVAAPAASAPALTAGGGVVATHDGAEEEYWDALEGISEKEPEEGCEEQSDSEWDKFEEEDDAEWDRNEEEDDVEDEQSEEDKEDEGGKEGYGDLQEEGEEEEEEEVFEDAQSDAFEYPPYGEAWDD